MIPIEQAVYFEAADKYVLMATEDGDALIRESLRNLLPQLDPQRFTQVHRGRNDRPLVSRVFAHLFRPM